MISGITITGADDKVNTKELLKLSEKYPFVEWGLLFANGKDGESRFLKDEWIMELLTNMQNYKMIKLAAHICGKRVLDYANNSEKNMFAFKRVQLNVLEKNITKEDIKNITKVAFFNNQELITQYNMNNLTLHKKFEELTFTESPHTVLFDSSGGKGLEINNILPPFEGNFKFGYAGGINTDNVEDIIERINKVTIGQNVYTDIETGARDKSDNLDIKKVQETLKKCKKYIKN